MNDHRYPLQPLAQLAGMSNRQALLALKVSGTTYQKYRDQGMLRDAADRAAVRLGFHPYEVWPEMVDHDSADAERAEEERRAKRKAYRRAYYLANKEKAIARQREADARDRETKIKYARWYYRTHREEVLAKQRERDQAKAARLRLLAQMEREQIPLCDREQAA